jgi:hypothetical protein
MCGRNMWLFSKNKYSLDLILALRISLLDISFLKIITTSRKRKQNNTKCSITCGDFIVPLFLWLSEDPKVFKYVYHP